MPWWQGPQTYTNHFQRSQCQKISSHLYWGDRNKSYGSITSTIFLQLSILSFPSYFPTFPSSRLAILFTRNLEAVNFDFYKHVELVYVDLRLKGNTTVDWQWEATSTTIFTIHGIFFCRISTMLDHSQTLCSAADWICSKCTARLFVLLPVCLSCIHEDNSL